MGIIKRSKPIQETEVEGIGVVRAGKLVSHPMFGEGEIIGIAEWESGEITINIEFTNYGSKWLVPEFAKLSEVPEKSKEPSKKGFLKWLFKK
ncbi:hypothetical protein [Alteromonas lipotrueae]|uniref:hypothetical protein n=1 Tax=Alteromonas lipotrueae TaxID=2803814 RepID=UPI001C4824D3|nr:hypothetical protein [Alteromonas lipotrueae]